MSASRPRRRDAAGFTLIEVLVALIIVALGASAMLVALRTAADSAQRQRERMLAGYVAMNRIIETRLEPEWPSLGSREGVVEMGGRPWRWRQEITRTPFEGVLQITVQVRAEPPGGTAAGGARDRAARDAGWAVTLTGARGRSMLVDPGPDRLWDTARREGP
ncbi:MAG: type II secretion system protein GspI [Gammaproteobacteria bacterium]|nr:type II secretion system protein GspI [Gammaproteobacteria bacterium]